jgi:hypothetical protein
MVKKVKKSDLGLGDLPSEAFRTTIPARYDRERDLVYYIAAGRADESDLPASSAASRKHHAVLRQNTIPKDNLGRNPLRLTTGNQTG